MAGSIVRFWGHSIDCTSASRRFAVGELLGVTSTGVLDGNLFEGEAGVKRLSDFPTKEEAQAKVVQLVLAPGANVLGAAKGAGGRILGVIKTIQEKLESGETIAKIG